MKSLIDEFNIEIENNSYEEMADYDAFPNKHLLDELRTHLLTQGT